MTKWPPIRDLYTIEVCSRCGVRVENDRDYGYAPAHPEQCEGKPSCEDKTHLTHKITPSVLPVTLKVGPTSREKEVLLHILSEVEAMGLGFFEPEAAASVMVKVKTWAKGETEL